MKTLLMGLEYFHHRRFVTGSATGTPAAAGSAGTPVVEVPAQSGGPATALTLEAIQGLLQPVLKLKDELPGMVKRLTAEHLEQKESDAAKLAREQQAAKDRASETELQRLQRENAENKEKMAAYERDQSQFKEKMINSQKTAELARSINPLSIIPDVRGMVLEDIAKQVQVDDATGAFFMVSERKLPNTGETVKERVSVADGVQSYLAARPRIVLTQVTGGTGSAATGSTAQNDNTTYEELIADPAKMTEAVKEKGRDYVEKLWQRSRATKVGRR